MSIQTSEQIELERLMKRLQIGTTNYNAANDLHAECYGTIGRMAGELERLRAEVAALRKDAERLNWLEQHPDKPMRFHKKHWSCVGFTSYEYEVHRTARAAIDAAMSEQAMQELVDQAQELDMGYGERK